jgi:hypothetical protein
MTQWLFYLSGLSSFFGSWSLEFGSFLLGVRYGVSPFLRNGDKSVKRRALSEGRFLIANCRFEI